MQTTDLSDYLALKFKERSAVAGRQISITAETIRVVAGELRQNPNAAILSDLAARGAEVMDRAGVYLQETPPHRMISDAQKFGRRRPWVVATLGLVTGIAAARLLKSTAVWRNRGELS